MGFDIKKVGLTMILSLVLVTILSSLLSGVLDISILRTGPSFILLLISVFIIYFFVAVSDGKINKQEIWTMVLIAFFLILSGWALKRYFPEIFSILPQQTKDLFSSIIP